MIVVKRWFSLFLALLMVFSLLPVSALAEDDAPAAEPTEEVSLPAEETPEPEPSAEPTAEPEPSAEPTAEPESSAEPEQPAQTEEQAETEAADEPSPLALDETADDTSETESVEAQLRAAIQNGSGSFEVSENLTLSESLAIPDGFTLNITGDAVTLTIPNGVTLTNEGDVYVNSGATIRIEAGGTMVNALALSLFSRGALVVENGGSFQFVDTGFANVWGGTITVSESGIYSYGDAYSNHTDFHTEGGDYTTDLIGLPADFVTLVTNVSTEDGIRAVFAKSGQVHSVCAVLSDTASVELASHLEIPADGELQITGAASLTVPAGMTLTNNGFIYMSGSARLTVNEGGETVNNGTINAYGSSQIAVAGTFTSAKGSKIDKESDANWSCTGTYVDNGKITTVAELEEALAAATFWDTVAVNTAITLDRDITVPEKVTLTFGNGGSLTVPSGYTFTNNGLFVAEGDASVTVQSGGKFANPGSINLLPGSSFTVEENGVFQNDNFLWVENATVAVNGTYTDSETTQISYSIDNLSFTMTMTGIDPGKVKLSYQFTGEKTDDALTEAFTRAAEYGSVQVTLVKGASVSCSSDVTIPENGKILLRYASEITVLAGAAITNYGDITLMETSKLTVGEDGSLVNRGTVSAKGNSLITVAGFFSDEFSGTLNKESDANWSCTGSYMLHTAVSTLDELKAALATDADHVSVFINDPITIESDFTVPRACQLLIENGGSLTVSGGTFTNNGSLNVLKSGTLTVNESAEFVNAGLAYINGGTLTVNGTYTPQGERGRLDYATSIGEAYPEEQVGVPASYVTREYDTTSITEEQLRSALADTRFYAVNVTLRGSAAVDITSDLTLPEKSNLVLRDTTAVAVKNGATLTNNGSLNIGADSAVTVEDGSQLVNRFNLFMQENGKLTIKEGAVLTNYDVVTLLGESLLTVAGTFTAASGSEILKSSDDNWSCTGTYTELPKNVVIVRTLDELKAAFADHMIATLTGTIALDSDFTVPESRVLIIDGGSLTVPDKVTLTVIGTVSITAPSTLTVNEGGTLKNCGSVMADAGTLTVNGTYTPLEDSGVTYITSIGDTYPEEQVGVPASCVTMEYKAESITEAQLRAAYADTRFRRVVVDLYSSTAVDITYNFTLPENGDLVLWDTSVVTVKGGTFTNSGNLKIGANSVLTVADSAILTNRSQIYMQESGKLNVEPNARVLNYGTVNATGSSRITVEGTFYAASGSTLSKDSDDNWNCTGTYEDLPIPNEDVTVTTLEELKAALNSEEEYLCLWLRSAVALDGSLTVPSSRTLVVQDGGKLTVPSGATLTNEGSININAAGEIAVADGGKLENNGYITVRGGKLAVNGEYTTQGKLVYCPAGGSTLSDDITGIASAIVNVEYWADSMTGAELIAAFDNREVNGVTVVLQNSASVELTADLEIPANGTLILRDTSALTVTNGAKIINEGNVQMYGSAALTLSAGTEFKNNGTLRMSGEAKLTVTEGATLANTATLDATEDSLLTINGTLSNSTYFLIAKKNWSCTGTIEGNVTFSLSSAEEIAEALAAGETSIYVANDVTLTESVTIPAGTMFQIDGNLTIAEGATFTNKGTFLLFAPSKLIIQGTFVNDGSAQVNAFGVSVEGGTLSDNTGLFVRSAEVWSEEEIRAAIAAEADRIMIFGSITVNGDLEIPQNVQLSVEADGSLTVNRGAALTNRGTIRLWGSMDVQGTYTGNPVYVYAGSVLMPSSIPRVVESNMTPEEKALRDAIADTEAEWWEYTLTSEIALSGDLDIPEGFYLYVEEGGKLIVPSGFTLTNRGMLLVNGGVINVQPNSRMVNDGSVQVLSTGRITVDALAELENNRSMGANGGQIYVNGEYIHGANANVWFAMTNGSSYRTNISGISRSYLDLNYIPETDADLKDAFAQHKYVKSITIALGAKDLTVGFDLTVPENAFLTLEGGSVLTVKPGITLTNNGTINVISNSRLVVSEGAVLVNNGTIEAVEEDSFFDPGVFLSAQAPAAVQVDETGAGATGIEICSGGALINNNALNILKGAGISVKENATLANNGSMVVSEAGVTIDGTYQAGENSRVNLDTSGVSTVSGIERKDMTNVCIAVSEDDIVTAFATAGEARAVDVRIKDGTQIKLTADLVIPANGSLSLNDSAQLTVPQGVALTNNGYLYAGDSAILTVLGTLAGTGTGDVGIYNIDTSGAASANTKGLTFFASVTTTAELKDAIAKKAVNIYINAESMMLEESVTVPKGVTLTNNASALQVESTLTIAAGAALVNNAVVLVGDGKLAVNGTYTPVGDSSLLFDYSTGRSYSTYVTGINYKNLLTLVTFAEKEADIRKNFAASAKVYSADVHLADDDIALTADLTVPENGYLCISGVAELTVPSGKTLTNNGMIRLDGDGKLTVTAGAALNINGSLLAVDTSLVTVEGTANVSESGHISAGIENWRCPGTLNDADDGFAPTAEATTVAALEEAIAAGAKRLYVSGDMTLDKDFELPEGVSLTVSGADNSLTVPADRTLKLEGGLDIDANGAVLVDENGTLTVSGGSIFIDAGTLTVNGTYDSSFAGKITFFADAGNYKTDLTGVAARDIKLAGCPQSEEALRALLAAAADACFVNPILFDTSIALSDDLTIPGNVRISMYSGAILTVSAGKTLTIEKRANAVYYNNGLELWGNARLDIEADAQLINNGSLDCSLSLEENSKLHIKTGAALINNASMYVWSPAEITVDGTFIMNSGSRAEIDLDSWNCAGTLEDYSGGHLTISAYPTTAAELENAIAKGATDIGIFSSITLRKNLTIPEGVTVRMFNGDGQALTVPKGITLTNHGTLNIAEPAVFTVAGTFINEDTGSARIEYSCLRITGAFYDDNGMTDWYVDAGTAEELAAALESGADTVYVRDSIELSDSCRVDGKRLVIYGSLTVSKGYVLYNDGEIYVHGTLDVLGDFYGNAPYAFYGSTVTPDSVPRHTEGEKAESITLFGSDTVLIGTETVYTYSIQPDNAWSDWASFEIVSGGGLADINAESGVFSAGMTPGTVVIRAETFDGSGVYAEKTVEIVETEPEYDTKLALTQTTAAQGDEVALELSLEGNPGLIYLSAYLCYDRNQLELISVEDGAMTGWFAVDGGWTSLDRILWPNFEVSDVNGTIATLHFRVRDGAAAGPVRVTLTGRIAQDADGNDVNVSMTPGGVTVKNHALRPAETDYLVSGKKLTFTLWNIPKNAKAAATWSLAAGDEVYASLSSSGVLTAKAVDSEHTVTVTATAKDGETLTRTVRILPKTTKVELTLDGAAVTGTIPVDMFAQPVMQLAAATYPADALDEVKWTSSATSVARVDENGLVTLVKPGKAVIKAAAQDGSGKTAQLTLTVTYLDAAGKLTLKAADVPKLGLQPGQSVQLTLSGKNEIAAENIEFTISEKQAAMGSVDANGVFTAGTTAGTVTVTAALKGDPLKRKATVTIKVIPMQAAGLMLTSDLPDDQIQFMEAEPMGIIDRADVMQNALTIALTPAATDYTGSALTVPKLKWVSKDTSIATVNAQGVVTVKKGANGTVAIEATAQDLTKTVARFWVQVRDYSPRLAAATVTLNTALQSGVSVGLVESFGNAVTSVSLSDERFTAAYDNGVLTVKTAETVKNGTYKMTLTAECANGIAYPYTVTVKVTKTFPSVTVKQTEKFNLFYTDSTAALTVTVKGQTVTGVTLADCDFVLTADESGQLVLTYADPDNIPAKPDTKGTLYVTLEGYAEPVAKAITVSTVTTAPKLKLSATASTVNTALKSDHSTAVRLLDAAGNEQDLSGLTVTTATAGVEATEENNAIVLTPTANKTVTATVEVQGANWIKSVKLTHKITVTSKLPTLKPAVSTLKLSSVFTAKSAATALVLSQSNLTLQNVTVTPSAKEGTAARVQSDKLNVYYDGAKIVAEIADETVKAGTYSFTVRGTLEDGTEIAGGTVKVTVAATAPTVKLSAGSAKLNRYLAGNEYLNVKVTLKNGAGYTVTGFEGMPDGMSYDEESGILTVTLPDGTSTGGTYKLKAVVRDDTTGQTVTLPTSVTFKVTTYMSSKLSVSLSVSGKLDTQNPAGAILYKVNRINNSLNTAELVTLEGKDADKFDVALDTSGAKPVIRLTMVAGEEYSTSAKYRVQFRVVASGAEVLSAVQTVRVTQSTLKLKAATPVRLYQSQTVRLGSTLTVTAPVTAEIADVQLNTAKTPALFLAAIGGAEGFEAAIEGGEAKLTFAVSESARLRAGSSYTVVLDVTPANCATNVKPTQVKITVKVMK